MIADLIMPISLARISREPHKSTINKYSRFFWMDLRYLAELN